MNKNVLLKPGLIATLGFAMSVSMVSIPVQAATATWIGGSSWWEYGSNWDIGVQPAPGDDVYLTKSDVTNRVVSYYNTLYPNATDTLNSLTINATGTGTMTLDQTSYAHPLYTGNEYIGYTGVGSMTQSGGDNTVTNYLHLGYADTANGSYDLSGGTLSARYEYIGVYGTGIFNQTGGSHTLTNDLSLGTYATGNGTYTLNGGTLDVGGDIVNGSGIGTLEINGGTLNVAGGNVDVDSLYLGSTSGSIGSHTLSGTDTITVVNEYIGSYGTGVFTQSGGVNTVSNNLSQHLCHSQWDIHPLRRHP